MSKNCRDRKTSGNALKLGTQNTFQSSQKQRLNRCEEASVLPKICNLNPRSLYNKTDEFHALVREEELDVIFISESWEREDKPLSEIIQLSDHEVFANVNQRKGTGGRPAIVANVRKYHVENVTNSLIQVPWGVEAIWCILTPKGIRHNSKIKKIACCSMYISKPSSKRKSLFLDHISEGFNILSAKYSQGLEFIFSGDVNDLKLSPILSLSPRLNQIVQDWTRLDPPAILDPIIMTLSHLYQKPVCQQPLDADSDKIGKRSDHRIVIAEPINEAEQKCSRLTRVVKFRPITAAGIEKMKVWFLSKDWNDIYTTVSAHDKARIFQNTLLSVYNECFPEKSRKVSSDDQPWITFKLKQMDRKRKRVYRKERRSEKWKLLEKEFQKELKSAKSDFYKKSISELKRKKPSQWFSCLKKISTGNQSGSEALVVTEIEHLNDDEQAEAIAEKFVSVQNSFEALKSEDIKIPDYSNDDIPQFHEAQVWFVLSRLETNKATVKNDIPAKIIKRFAAYLAEPFTNILNTAIRRGEYPDIYKYEICTPVPKSYPPESLSQLRNISGLLTFDKVAEKLIAELILADMEPNLDRSQFGNQKGISINHYLVQMLDRILESLDKSSEKEKIAVLANFIDWENAFPRQCHKLGVESFMRNGVRPSLIPILVNYFQNRKMSVRWHNCLSVPREIKGGGPQGATLGLIEYLSQSNNNVDFVDLKDKYKFIDDLSLLEKMNLLRIGIATHNLRSQVPNDVPLENHIIPSENLRSQEWLNQINEWTDNQKMLVNAKKTKSMIFNFCKQYNFTTRLVLKNENVEVVKQTKLLGSMISDDLKWDLNTATIVKKANQRLEILRRLSAFSPPVKDLKEVYILFVRSILEQSAVVWHGSLTVDNRRDLERVQKTAARIILKNSYTSYKKALAILEIETLDERRKLLCINFAKKCTTHPKLKHMFPRSGKTYNTRWKEQFKVNFARTERYRNSSIPYMQRLLNENT